MAAADGRRGGDFARATLAPVTAHDILIRMLNNLRHSLIDRDQPVLLARMVPLRAAFAELADEREEHRHWMRHFN